MKVDHINPKGQPSYQVENFFDLMFTANNPDAIHIRNENERRPIVIMHPTVKPMSKEARDGLQAWFDNGGKEALLHYLMNVDVSGFDPWEPSPMFTGKVEMAKAGRTPAEQFVSDLLEDAKDEKNESPLKSFTTMLTEYVGVGRDPDKRDEQALQRALRSAGSFSRRARFLKDANPFTVYPIADLEYWCDEKTTIEEWIKRYRAGSKDDLPF
jgi:hypothetical protein